jgi:2-polyprenyl-3-methyl-5-hydroxy-6-metoxy-1,4-benzoquinol methylase
MSREITYKQRVKESLSAAKSYSKRKVKRHNAEMKLLKKGIQLLEDVSSVLDVPCGAGRATIMLAQAGFKATGADLGSGAVDVAKQAVAEANVIAKIDKADIENLFYEDNSFDAVLCFRMFHHFPSDEIRSRVISELCRVTDKYVIISYLSPFAATTIRRKLAYQFTGKKFIQHATSLKVLKRYFREHNFELIQDFAEMPFFHTLHLAVFRKKS